MNHARQGQAGGQGVGHLRRHIGRDGRRAVRATLGGFALVGLAVGSPVLGQVAAAAPSVAARTASTPAVSNTTASSSATRRVVQARPTLPSGTQGTGTVPAARSVSGAVALRPRNAAALTAYATGVSTPGSAVYHRYLAPGAFAARFGPSPTTVAGVESQLHAAGLKIASVSSNRLLVKFTGSAGAAGAAFGTHLDSYRLASGRAVTATAGPITLPASIAPAVQAVVGLDNVVQAHPEGVGGARIVHHGNARYAKAAAPATSSKAASGGPSACSAATATAKRYGGLTDTQIANAYGVNGLYSAGDTGAGQTVAIFELEPYARSDISAFDQCYFGASAAASMLSRLTTVPVDGGEQPGYGYGEASLDIQNISAIAPGAAIHVYEAPNTEYGSLDEYNTIVNADTAKTVSTSWGFCELALQQVDPGTQQVENTIFEQAAAQGQTVFAASGDDGSDDCAESGPTKTEPYLSVDDPGSQPFVVSAGGTTTTDATLPPKEKVWNDGADGGGGGGGISGTWAAPSWQSASKVPGIDNATIVAEAEQRAGNDFCQTAASGAAACREVPDVSANADENTGAITVYYQGQWGTVGGTSAAAPLWAAMLADTDASEACGTTGGVGFANPLLYAVASVPSEYKASFTDVTSGNNDDLSVNGGLFPATAGYDTASGLGTPQITAPGGGDGLAYYLCQAATPTGGGTAAARPTVSAVQPPVVSGAGGAQVTVTGSGFESTSGASDVSGVQIGTYQVPAAYVHVTGATTLSLTVPAASVLAGAAGNSPIDGNGDYQVLVSLTNGTTSAPGAASRLVVTDPNAAAGAPEVDGVGASGGNEAGLNTVTVYGSGLTGATAVTFGGVSGNDVTVVNDRQLTVQVPAYSGATVCAQATNPTTDVCQVQVRVTTSAGTSPAGTISTPLTGAYNVGPLQVPVLPAGCDCELAPGPTEYDYLPTPTITSVTARPAGADGTRYASSDGTTIETINGRGLGILGLEWVDVGPASQYTSEDYSYTYVSGTELKVVLPAQPASTTIRSVPLFVQTLASPNSANLASTTVNPSNAATVLYAPVPSVSSVTSTRYDAGPTTGGTSLTIHGDGLAAAGTVVFTDPRRGYTRTSTSTLHVVSNTEITLKTPAAPAGIDSVHVCDATTCSVTTTGATFTYFPTGDPRVSSVSPRTGPAGGGTRVTVRGVSLGFLKAVYFGTKETTRFTSTGSPSDVGSTTSFTVTAPSGSAGSKVNVRVVTLQSESTKVYPKSPVNTSDTFTYDK